MTNNSSSGPGYKFIDTLFRHNLWANMRLFELCAGLSEDQLDSRIVSAYGSIRDTLQHIAGAEASYLHRIKTGQPKQRPEGAPPPTLLDLQASIRESGEGLIEVAPTIEAHDSVQVDWEGAPRSIPCAILATQAINHATEHREQIMAMLTELGIQPPDLDGWTYYDSIDPRG